MRVAYRARRSVFRWSGSEARPQSPRRAAPREGPTGSPRCALRAGSPFECGDHHSVVRVVLRTPEVPRKGDRVHAGLVADPGVSPELEKKRHGLAIRPFDCGAKACGPVFRAVRVRSPGDQQPDCTVRRASGCATEAMSKSGGVET